MSKVNKKIIDSVSASELLKALNTLQHMSDPDNDAEISFCDESKVKSQFKTNNSKAMNYEQYMAKKVENKHRGQQPMARKSISPLKEENVNQTIKINNLKSRSHSPINYRQERTDRSMLITQKKTTKAHTNNQNKENKREFHNNKNDNLYRASFQSKKILDEKEKKGLAYKPIQYRTEELLKEKQVKLAKLQKEQELTNILKEKECTFKPNIIKNYKKSKVTLPKEQKQLQLIEQESVRFDSGYEENEFLCTPTQPNNVQQIHGESTEYLTSNCARQLQENSEPKQSIKKYKNQKFNFLLDLIH